jgi:hypothetical protein
VDVRGSALSASTNSVLGVGVGACPSPCVRSTVLPAGVGPVIFRSALVLLLVLAAALELEL